MYLFIAEIKRNTQMDKDKRHQNSHDEDQTQLKILTEPYIFKYSVYACPNKLCIFEPFTTT